MGARKALLVGTSVYSDRSLAGLRAPNADIEALAAVLRSPEICAFDSVVMLNDQTNVEVRVAVSELFSQAGRDDLVLLYFTGHGILDGNGKLHFCTSDTRRSLPRATALPASYVCHEMDTTRSCRQLVILDCCHAGAFARGTKDEGGIGASVGTMSAFEGTGIGRTVLAASDATELAFEGDKIVGSRLCSLFTHFLVEGLQSGRADTNGDGLITVDELYEYTYARVLENTNQQTPSKWTYRQQGDVILARNPKPVALPELIDAGLKESLHSSKPRRVREAAVGELQNLLEEGRPGVALAARKILESLLDDDSRAVAECAANALARLAATEAAANRPSRTQPGMVMSALPRIPPSEAQSPAPQSRPADAADNLSGAPLAQRVPVARWKRAAWPAGAATLAGMAMLAYQLRSTGSAADQPAASATPTLRPNVPSKPSLLEVTSTMDEELTLFLDDKRIGPLPARVPMLPPGKHRLRVSAAGFVDFAKSVELPVGQSLLVGPVTLQRDPSQFVIERTPALETAKVYLIKDGASELVTSFPQHITMRAGVNYTLEAHWGSRFLSRAVHPTEKGSVIRLSEDARWEPRRAPAVPHPSHHPEPVPPPPPAQPTVRAFVSATKAEGLSDAQAKRSAAGLQSALASCQAPPGTEGHMTLRLTLDPAGGVAYPEESSHTNLTSDVRSCVIRIAKSRTYGSSEAGARITLHIRVVGQLSQTP